jgi:hypothetical protein
MLDDDKIKIIEEKYKGKYVIDSCLKGVYDTWANFPTMIFYTEKAHPAGSNYFALYRDFNEISEKTHWMITDGISGVQGDFYGYLFPGDELLHSRYRHDYCRHGGIAIDGGRDYVRVIGEDKSARGVKFNIVNGEIKIQ